MKDSPILMAFSGINPWFLSIYAFVGLKLDFWKSFGKKTDFSGKGVPLLIYREKGRKIVIPYLTVSAAIF